MVNVTAAAANYEAPGDTDHVAYGKDFAWDCACGASSAFFMTERKAMKQAENHGRVCKATPTVTVMGE